MRRTWLIGLGTWLRRLIEAHRRRRDVARLESLPDHMLRDIGISRSEIDRSVREGRDNRAA
ncbi:MAG: DUF1127 domain-containing protein [Rhodospirillaceae bacterium]|nr:DUF1127 domain-containing protein [Rhodospirillaceae bacterium]